MVDIIAHAKEEKLGLSVYASVDIDYGFQSRKWSDFETSQKKENGITTTL